MPCERKSGCECIGGRRQLSAFCQHWNAERPYDDTDRWVIANWQALPAELRGRCVQHLRSVVPAKVVETWRAQRAREIAPGSESLRFHFEVGMQVRNALRDAAADDQLPTGNWDDYYVGAIDDLAANQPAPASA